LRIKQLQKIESILNIRGIVKQAETHRTKRYPDEPSITQRKIYHKLEYGTDLTVTEAVCIRAVLEQIVDQMEEIR